jgi:hypothetical protein
MLRSIFSKPKITDGPDEVKETLRGREHQQLFDM